MVLKTGVLGVCLLVIPIAISWTEHQDTKPEVGKRHYGYGKPSPSPSPPPPEPSAKLCKGTVSNRTINTPCGKVHCLVPTMDEMIEQLNTIGGYNRHYVAITLEEAEKNFDNLLPEKEQAKPTSPGYGGHRKRPHKGRWRWRWRGRGRGHRHGRGRGRGRGRGHIHIHIPPVSGDANAQDLDFKEEQKRQAVSSVSCLTPTCQAGGYSTVDGYRTCPACQRCRKLDDTLFPKYVNEVTCDDSASGYSKTIYCTPEFFGQCKQKTMTIDVLSNSEENYKLIKQEGLDFFFKQLWKKKTIEIKSCCECFVQDPKILG